FFLFLFFVYLPAMVILAFSVNDSVSVALPFQGFTMRWYQAMYENDAVWHAFRSSVIVASATAVLATAIGLMAAMAVSSENIRHARKLIMAIVAPSTLPTIVIGIGLLVLFLSVLRLNLSLATIIAGHTLLCMPLAFLIILPRIEGFDRNLLDASLDLGRTPFRTFREITAPIIAPGIFASLIVCFITSFDEFTVAFFLSDESTTLPVYIFAQLRLTRRFPELLALSACILLLSLALLLLTRWLAGPIFLSGDEATDR
ncbi:ABC transporter permease, partial [Salmonella enterica subsp. enterica]|nr:ABC transporter permease [Salmonella enterica subsp. enterica serovar Enteritidis]